MKGFKPITKYFTAFKITETKAYEILKEKALKIQAFMGFKPMTKYYSAFEISKEKAYEMLKARANGM